VIQLSPELNGLQTLIVVAKMFAVMSMAAFILFSGVGQYWYWTKNKLKDYPHMTKKFQMLYDFGKWEFKCFLAYAVLFLAIALVSAIWDAATRVF